MSGIGLRDAEYYDITYAMYDKEFRERFRAEDRVIYFRLRAEAQLRRRDMCRRAKERECEAKLLLERSLITKEEEENLKKQAQIMSFAALLGYPKRVENLLVNKSHPWHVVKPSAWPFFSSVALSNLIMSVVCYLHNFSFGVIDFLFKTNLPFVLGNLFLFCVCIACWLLDVVREGSVFGHHTYAVELGIRLGFILFLVSEVMFFFSFFWAFFHSSLNPSVHIGGVWPPVGIVTFDAWGIPLLNTFILLCSGVTLTYGHYAFFIRHHDYVWDGICFTLIYGGVFSLLQCYEYFSASFSIYDGIYASCFYLLTGFHGFHVIIGSIFLSVTLARHNRAHFSVTYHLGFEFAAWYWHFVDVIWIILYLCVYCWGS